MGKVNYIKNCVEEELKRPLSNYEYQQAYARSCSYEAKNMADRIKFIAICDKK